MPLVITVRRRILSTTVPVYWYSYLGYGCDYDTLQAPMGLLLKGKGTPLVGWRWDSFCRQSGLLLPCNVTPFAVIWLAVMPSSSNCFLRLLLYSFQGGAHALVTACDVGVVAARSPAIAATLWAWALARAGSQDFVTACALASDGRHPKHWRRCRPQSTSVAAMATTAQSAQTTHPNPRVPERASASESGTNRALRRWTRKSRVASGA